MRGKMDKFRKKVEEFSKLCDQVGIPLPDITENHVVGSEYTEPNHVRMSDEADVDHLFGHYLCEYHAIEPDFVADIIKNLLYGADKAFINRGFYPQKQKLGYINRLKFDRGYDESIELHIPNDGFEDA